MYFLWQYLFDLTHAESQADTDLVKELLVDHFIYCPTGSPWRQGLVPRFWRMGQLHGIVDELKEDLWDLTASTMSKWGMSNSAARVEEIPLGGVWLAEMKAMILSRTAWESMP